MTQEAAVPTPEEVRAALERILASAEFAGSQRLRQFLSFVVDESLAGRGEAIKGYVIGVEVYGKDTSFDPNVDPLVRVEASRLRKALTQYYAASGADDPLCINLPKGGYAPQFVRRTDAPGPVPDESEDEDATIALAARRRRSLWRMVGIAAVVSVIVSVALLLAYELIDSGAPQTDGAVATADADVQPAASFLASIAVHPFENLSGDPAKDYVAAGLTVEIVTELSRFKAFAVFPVDPAIAPPSDGAPPTGPLTLPPPSPSGMARYALSGSVRIGEGTISINARLVDATGTTLWAESFDRKLEVEQLIEIERDIAQRIATTISQPYGVIYDREVESIGTAPTSMAGYECVLRAYQYWRTLDQDEHKQVRECLEATIATDPEFASAWYALTFLYLDEFRYAYNPRPRQYRPLDKALEAAQRAVALAPGMAGSYQALYAALYFRGDLEGFRVAGETALKLNPNNPDIMGDFGNRLAIAGDWERGIALVKRAMELNPGHPGWYYVPLVYDAYRRGEYEDARRYAEQMNMPNFARSWSMLAMVYGQLGDRVKAQGAIQRLLELDPDFALNAAEDMRKWGLDPDLIAKCLDGLRKAGLEISTPSN